MPASQSAPKKPTAVPTLVIFGCRQKKLTQAFLGEQNTIFLDQECEPAGFREKFTPGKLKRGKYAFFSWNDAPIGSDMRKYLAQNKMTVGLLASSEPPSSVRKKYANAEVLVIAPPPKKKADPVPVKPPEPRQSLPTIISFYAGDAYYHKAAARLRDDCDRLGWPHQIVELPLPEHFEWPDICRLKIRFYHDMMVKLDRPILWLDVDTRIRAIPDFIHDFRFDFGSFLRGFRSLGSFDPWQFTRFWAPTVLLFNATPGGRKLIQAMQEIEATYTGRATDDFFLEEAWRKVGSELAAAPFPAWSMGVDAKNAERAAFIFGRSDNVEEFKSKVDQHENSRYMRVRGLIATDMLADTTDIQMADGVVHLAKADSIRDPDTLERLGTAYAKFNPAAASGILAAAAELAPLNATVRDTLARTHLRLGRCEAAEAVIASLRHPHQAATNKHRASLSTLLDAERRMQQRGITPDKRIRMWWARRPYPGNFGDILNPYLIEKITGAAPVLSEPGEGLLAIGSIIKFAGAATTVWGAGSSRRNETLSPVADYRLVRGPITRAILTDAGIPCAERYGDPALLLPRFFRPSTQKLHRLGYIPHYVHFSQQLPSDAHLIDVRCVGTEGIERFISEVCSCEAIISTSLHGIIIANAYGIPARWARFGGGAKKVHGDDMKFEDYFASVAMPLQAPLDLSEAGAIDSEFILANMDRTVDLRLSLDAILESFPHDRIGT